MITADTLKRMTAYTTEGLTSLIQASGYKKDKFLDSRFLGITNAGLYCYEVLYFDDNIEEECYTKVYVKHDQFEQTTVADY